MKKLLLFAALAMLIFTGCSKKQSIYDFSVKDIDGKEVSMAQYKGKVLLIVNVASKCGLTPQYEGLETIYQKYKDQGLEILAFPCNQFLGQEPGTNDEIQSFCSLTYNVTFPIFDKIDVNGENESPLYTYLKAQGIAKLGQKYIGHFNEEMGWVEKFTERILNLGGDVKADLAIQEPGVELLMKCMEGVKDLDNPVPTIWPEVVFEKKEASGKYVCSIFSKA